MSGRRPTWAQVRQFCKRQGFAEDSTDHERYDKVLSDGTLAWTKISFDRAETETVEPNLWPRIWKRQLRLQSEADFWSGVDGGPVNWDVPTTPELTAPLPDFLVRHLRVDRHLSDEEIAAHTPESAQALLNEWYMRQR